MTILVRMMSTFNSEVSQHSTKCRHRHAPHAASLARWLQLVFRHTRRAPGHPPPLQDSLHPVANNPASSALAMCLHSDNPMVPRTRLSIPRAGAGYSGKPGGFTSNLRLTWHWPDIHIKRYLLFLMAEPSVYVRAPHGSGCPPIRARSVLATATGPGPELLSRSASCHHSS